MTNQVITGFDKLPEGPVKDHFAKRADDVALKELYEYFSGKGYKLYSDGLMKRQPAIPDYADKPTLIDVVFPRHTNLHLHMDVDKYIVALTGAAEFFKINTYGGRDEMRKDIQEGKIDNVKHHLENRIKNYSGNLPSHLCDEYGIMTDYPPALQNSVRFSKNTKIVTSVLMKAQEDIHGLSPIKTVPNLPPFLESRMLFSGAMDKNREETIIPLDKW